MADSTYRRTVVPDRIDLRDRPYLPSVVGAPPARLSTLDEFRVRPLDQGETNACTGFALARMIDLLLRRAGRDDDAPVSPFMLYSMARRYDEFPGHTADEGSSLRGAMKGWYRHGACAQRLFSGIEMPPASDDPARDWWQDAVRRPLGAYYRVNTQSVVDMQLALRDTGVLYASAVCHSGWDEGLDLGDGRGAGWTIPRREALPSDGGHAFVIVGYDEDGFLVLNSWGTHWGNGGVGTLTYADWLNSAMDCWVAQLGVVTGMHDAVARASSLRVSNGHVEIATGNLRNQEIAPFVVDMENNGRLSSSGTFRTSAEDLRDLVTRHLTIARQRWKLAPGQPIDVAVYAHGGLTGESAAADTAARWIPALYERQVFPIFLMWETDLLSTVKNRLQDTLTALLAPEARPAAGMRSALERFWNERLERALAEPGSWIWGEMKQNAAAISQEGSGAELLYAIGRETGAFHPERIRLHLIGHSAGSILHCHAVKALVGLNVGWRFESVSFLAPAATVDLFNRTIAPELARGTIRRYAQWHLRESVEEKDPTCRAIGGYARSLLYLVSHSFEKGVRTPILGLERDYRNRLYPADRPNIRAFAAPGPASGSTTHGGFDDDALTMKAAIDYLKSEAIPRPEAELMFTPADLPAAAAAARGTEERRKRSRGKGN
jgi:hypothetical protein